MDRHVVRDEVAVGDEVMVLDGHVLAEVGGDHVDDAKPRVSSLWPSGVVHHVDVDQVVDNTVSGSHAPKELRHNRLWVHRLRHSRSVGR